MQIADIRSQPAQCIHQIPNRALMHAGNPGKPVTPSTQRKCGSQRAESRAGISQERPGLLNRKTTGTPVYPVGVSPQCFDGHSQGAQPVQHDIGIIGMQQVVNFRCPMRQSGKKQNAVGYAFRAGKACRSPRTEQRRRSIWSGYFIWKKVIHSQY